MELHTKELYPMDYNLQDSQRNDSIKSIQRSGVTLAWQNLSILVPDKNIHLPNTRPKQRVVKNGLLIIQSGT